MSESEKDNTLNSERIVQPSVEEARRLVIESNGQRRFVDALITAVTAAHQQERQALLDSFYKPGGTADQFAKQAETITALKAEIDEWREISVSDAKARQALLERADALQARLTAVELEQTDHGAALLLRERDAEVLEQRAERLLMSYTARFEQDAEAFYRATGFIAPGRSVPAAMGGYDEDQRQVEWDKWIAEQNDLFRWALLAGAAALRKIGSGNRAAMEPAPTPRRSAAPKPSSSPSLTPVDQQRPAHEHD
jgi:hypothetical protein